MYPFEHLAPASAVLEFVHSTSGNEDQCARRASVGLPVANEPDRAAQHVERFAQVVAVGGGPVLRYNAAT